MSDNADRELQKILDDNLSGSSELLSRLNDYFLKNYKSIDNPSKLINSLKKRLSSFQGIQNFLSKLESLFQKDLSSVGKFLNNYSEESKIIYDKLFHNLPDKILQAKYLITISNSKTVTEILKLIFEKTEELKVFIAESRPQLEGRIEAEKLSQAGIYIQLITEAQLPGFVEKCDYAIIGADKILKDGSAVNKVGSRSLAILCKYFKKPFYVITNRSKFSNQYSFDSAVKSSTEIWETREKKIKIDNYYFEKIEKELITEIISN